MKCCNLHLTQYDDSVKVKCASWDITGRPRYSYYTNDYGDGIFEYDSKTGNVRQLTGTCQFTIAGYTASGARAKINRWIEQHMMED